MPFSDEEQALIAAIHADPKNDAPRLAYADWCQPHELTELAEFIRLMCREPYPQLEDGRRPRIDVETWELKHDDPDRCSRLVELLGKIYGSERFPETRLRDGYYRGIPVYQCELFDGMNDRHISHLSQTPLARFEVWLYTCDVSPWLMHPLMDHVDVLRVHPRPAASLAEVEDGEDEPQYVTEAFMRAFLESHVIERLDTLNLCAYLTPEAEGLVDELKERVNLDLSH